MARNLLLLAAAACLVGSAAEAQTAPSEGVTLTSSALIGHQSTGANGKVKVEWNTPDKVMAVPGDQVRFTMRYTNHSASPVTNFQAVNPLPGAVEFRSVQQDWAEVSVDGGKSWGKLGQLNVAVTDPATGQVSRRPATAADVTHLRWTFPQPIPAHGGGELGYEGVIR